MATIVRTSCIFIQSLLILLYCTEPPQPPLLPPLVAIAPSPQDAINTTYTITWGQSSCAVQYVVSISTSDDRVYPNITTTDNSTTVALPTGMEFCVTVVGVDSIGRRGSPSEPKCYPSKVVKLILI